MEGSRNPHDVRNPKMCLLCPDNFFELFRLATCREERIFNVDLGIERSAALVRRRKEAREKVNIGVKISSQHTTASRRMRARRQRMAVKVKQFKDNMMKNEVLQLSKSALQLCMTNLHYNCQICISGCFFYVLIAAATLSNNTILLLCYSALHERLVDL